LRRSSIDPSNKSTHVPVSASGERTNISSAMPDHSKGQSLASKRLSAATGKSLDRNNMPNFMIGSGTKDKLQ